MIEPARVRAVLTVLGVALAAVSCAPAGGTGTHPGSSGSHACSPSVTIDSFSDELDGTTFAGADVANLSSLALDPDGQLAALSDRSLLFTLDPRTKRPLGVVALADEQGRPLDSEGLAIDRDGSRLVTSETEPSVRRYARDGRLLASLPVPAPLHVFPAGRATRNLTFEGLALGADDRSLVASMEGALSGDSPDSVRLQTWTRGSGSDEFRLGPQLGYRVDPGLGVSEINAVGDGRLLVVERGFTSGVGNAVRLYLADPRQAGDVTGVRDLTGQGDVRLVAKTLLADIARCPSLGATAREPQPNPLLDNIEGMTITSRDPDGTLHLLMVSDNNQNPRQVTRLYSLAVELPSA